MKKFGLFLITALFTYGSIAAQEQQQKPSRFSLALSGGIGYAIIKNNQEPDYNVNTNGGEILLNYKINNKHGIATGLGLIELSGNGFNSLGDFYHERTLVKIPLLYTSEYKVADNIKLMTNIGLYAQNIAKDEYQYLNASRENLYKDWNIGCQLGLGIAFKLYDKFSTGLSYTGQSDLSKIKTQQNKGITDKQLMKNLNYLSVIFLLDL